MSQSDPKQTFGSSDSASRCVVKPASYLLPSGYLAHVTIKGLRHRRYAGSKLYPRDVMHPGCLRNFRSRLDGQNRSCSYLARRHCHPRAPARAILAPCLRGPRRARVLRGCIFVGNSMAGFAQVVIPTALICGLTPRQELRVGIGGFPAPRTSEEETMTTYVVDPKTKDELVHLHAVSTPSSTI
jgi:hypothetical protein